MLTLLWKVQIAKRQGVVNPENTFFSVKRFVGRKSNEVKAEQQQMPYRIVSDASGNVKIDSKHAGKQFAPEEISALVLRKLVDDASKFLNDKVCAHPSLMTCWCLQYSEVSSIALRHQTGEQGHADATSLLGQIDQKKSFCSIPG